MIKSSLISKEIEEGIYNLLIWKHKTIKNGETCSPIPRKGWLEEAKSNVRLQVMYGGDIKRLLDITSH
jgi:hypothetical protein